MPLVFECTTLLPGQPDHRRCVAATDAALVCEGTVLAPDGAAWAFVHNPAEPQCMPALAAVAPGAPHSFPLVWGVVYSVSDEWMAAATARAGAATQQQVHVTPTDGGACAQAAARVIDPCTDGRFVTLPYESRGSAACFSTACIVAALPTYSYEPQRQPWCGGGAPQAPLVLVITDGGGDMLCAAQGHRTPMEAACDAAPGLSVVARHGVCGTMDPLEAGVACGSETAHLSILGYDPRVFFRGRGAYEALGGGMAMRPGDLAFKCNFATMDDASGIVVRRKCASGFDADAATLCAAIDGTVVAGCTVMCKHAGGHRCGVVLRRADGAALSSDITDTDPIVDGPPLRRVAPVDGLDAARHAAATETATIVNAVSDAIRALLRDHAVNVRRATAAEPTANVVLLRGAAGLHACATFEQRHGLRACALAPTCVIAGLCATLGMARLPPTAAMTGKCGSDFNAKVDAVLSAVRRRCSGGGGDSDTAADEGFDFALLHVKATDDAGHDGDARLKCDEFVRVGAALQRLWDGLPPGSVVAVTSDHSTPCDLRDHSADPVPFCAAVKGAEGAVPSAPDARFDELWCASNGVLGRFDGACVVPLMLELQARARGR